MAEIALNVIGIVLGNVLGIISLLSTPTLTPDPLTAGHSIVRIGIGLPTYPPVPSFNSSYQTMGGTIPSFRVYNENKALIGHATSDDHQTVGEGQFRTVTVVHNTSGLSQQPSYLQVAGGSDDVCIAYLGQTWSDGTKLGWLGDIGKFCGARWYYSNLFVEMSNGTMYKVSSYSITHIPAPFLVLVSVCPKHFCLHSKRIACSFADGYKLLALLYLDWCK
jgi:hypothetical protein